MYANKARQSMFADMANESKYTNMSIYPPTTKVVSMFANKGIPLHVREHGLSVRSFANTPNQYVSPGVVSNPYSTTAVISWPTITPTVVRPGLTWTNPNPIGTPPAVKQKYHGLDCNVYTERCHECTHTEHTHGQYQPCIGIVEGLLFDLKAAHAVRKHYLKEIGRPPKDAAVKMMLEEYRIACARPSPSLFANALARRTLGRWRSSDRVLSNELKGVLDSVASHCTCTTFMPAVCDLCERIEPLSTVEPSKLTSLKTEASEYVFALLCKGCLAACEVSR